MILTKHLHRCAAALSDGAAPAEVYQAVQEATAATIGHHLFTLLITTGAEAGGGDVERVWTSNPASYPVQGRKRMGPTPWGAQVLAERRAWMCNDAEGIRWAFPDHELIEGLGLAASINVPVAAFGRTLGTLNLLDRAGAYTRECLENTALFAPFLVPCFQAARA